MGNFYFTNLAYNIEEEDLFQNIHYIHPLMQKDVSNLVKWCKSNPQVTKLVVVGSSTFDYCDENSDIDIVVYGVGVFGIDGIFEVTKAPLDVILGYRLEGVPMFELGNPTVDFCKSLEKTGVVVYEKDQGGL